MVRWGGQECRLKRATLARQQMFIEKLVSMVKAVTRESGNRKKKVVDGSWIYNYICNQCLPLLKL
jgi:hypothetical protein